MGAAFQEGDEGVQVPRGGVRVEQGGFEPEAAVGVGAAEDGAAFVQEGAAQGGDLGVIGVGGPEEHGGEGGGCVEFEVGVGVEACGEVVGECAGVVDEVGEAVAAE